MAVHTPKTTAEIDSAYRGSKHENRVCLIAAIGLYLLVAYFPFIIASTFQGDGLIYQAKYDDAVVLRTSPVRKETFSPLQMLQERFNLTDGNMAQIQNVLDEETKALQLENAELQRENAAFEHIVNQTELHDRMINYQAKYDDAAVLRTSPVRKKTLSLLQILQEQLNITDGNMARIQDVLYEKTESLRLKNAEFQRENAAFEHMVSRSEWAAGMLKSFDHFFMHIPKTGCTYVMDVLPKILQKSPQWNRLLPYNKYGLCSVGLKPLARFPSFPYRIGGVRCTMWMSEQPYSDIPQHTYTILRSPRAHILSQYFHCTESVWHRDRAHLMPSLDSWLDAWVDGLDNEDKRKQNGRFSCYSPINPQSTFALFDESVTKEVLRKRYDIIGDNAQMQKSVCLILIRYAKFVPSHCNCTGLPKNTSMSTNTGTFRHENKVKHSHGVSHHGATFNTTPHQEEAFAKLTVLDEQLYEMLVQDIFVEQVQEIEKEYQVTVCDTFRSSR